MRHFACFSILLLLALAGGAWAACTTISEAKTFSSSKAYYSGGICISGDVIKPDVVLYGEGLDEEIMRGAMEVISRADMLIVGGTDLSAYSAAGLIDLYPGNRLVLINKTPSPRDNRADLIVRDPIEEVFSQL